MSIPLRNTGPYPFGVRPSTLLPSDHQTQGPAVSFPVSLNAFNAGRLAGIFGLVVATLISLTWLSVAVPVRGPALLRDQAFARWPLAAAAWLVILLVDAVVLVAIGRWPSSPRTLPPRRHGTAIRHARVRIPHLVRLELIKPRLVITTFLTSVLLASVGSVLGFPIWVVALFLLTPWIPLYFSEAIWQYDHYGLYSLFGAITLLQLGHLGEHLAQVIQLIATHGNTAVARGIFGQLDIEAVHFGWNILIWLATCLLLFRFGGRNPWLWIAWVAASVHTPEHIYIYWLYIADHSFYIHGGVAGLLGRGGMFNSPLARPYLHLAYNIVEVVPFVIAFWDQSKILADRHLGRALPGLGNRELIALTSVAERVQLAAGETHVLAAPSFHVVVKGHVEPAPNPLGLRATRPTELLKIDDRVLARYGVGAQLPSGQD